MKHLSYGPLNMNYFIESYKSELLFYLDALPSPKAIYWNKESMVQLSQIIAHSTLKEHGVAHSSLLQTTKDSDPPSSYNCLIFIITPVIEVFKWIHSLVSRDMAVNRSRKYAVIGIPEVPSPYAKFLESKVSSKITIHDLPVTLLPLDYDVLSMENPSYFENCISGQLNGIYPFIQGLMRFQSVFGLFPRIRAKGENAVRVAKMLLRARHQIKTFCVGKSSSEVHSELDRQTDMVVLIDRAVDPLTPLLHQLTYEGLIDELWGIRHSGFGSSPDFLSGDVDWKKVKLTSEDPVFNDLRDQNFSAVGSILVQNTKEFSALINESKSVTDLTELRNVVGHIPEIRSKRAALEIHTSIAEQIQKYVSSDDFLASLGAQQDFLQGFETDKAHPYIEDCLLRVAPLNKVLRLMCIQSFCNGGLKQRLLEYYKSELLQVYGFEHMITLDNLNEIGLLHGGTASNTGPATETLSNLAESFDRLEEDVSSFRSRSNCEAKQTITAISNCFGSVLKRSLRLIVPPSPSGTGETDNVVSNVFSGYIPISTRLVQIMANDWYPKNPFSIDSQNHVSGPANVISKATNAFLAGTRLVSNFRSDDNIELSSIADTGSNGSQSKQSRASLSGQAPIHGASLLSSLVPAREFKETQIESVSTDLPCLMNSDQSNKSRVVVVVFIGGVTRAEISALRAISAAGDTNVEFVIITTGFLTSNIFLDSLTHKIQPSVLVQS